MTNASGNGKNPQRRPTGKPLAPGLKGAKMIGVGAFAPPSAITNDDLTQLVETSDEWITTRTGIRARRVVSGDMSVADMATEASRQALLSAGIDGSEIDLIVCATSTPDAIYPATACQVQANIGAMQAAGFDIALACSGFAYGMVIAQQFLRTGARRRALVIGADIHSHAVDWTDRNTCVLFGDGAGAAILEATDDADYFLGNDFQLDGSKGMYLTLFAPGENCPLVEPKTPANQFVYMNGREVFKFAVNQVPKTLEAALCQAGLTMQDIDHIVLHQANIRIMEAISERYGIPQEKMVVNLQHYGNTSAASIPLALNEAVLSGRIKPGDKVLMCGFGAGMAWSTTVLEWTAVDQRRPADLSNDMRATVPDFVPAL
ncbi:MAG: beta-ketoacyl-ACP synthase III [Candidatus Melainabacteria bacterium]